MQGVQGGDGNRIFGGSQDDTEWASGRGKMDLENLVHGGRAADVSHGLPGKGRPAELPCGGMPRTSIDEDGNAGPFPASEFPGHYGHFGGGKPPPPTVPLMRHDGPLAYTEQKAPCHRTVCHGSGAKEAAACIGRAEGEHGEGLQDIRGSAGNVTSFKCLGWVLKAGDDYWPAVVGNLSKARKSWRRLLRVLSWKGADLKVSRNFLSGVTGGVAFQGVDVGAYP